ncbi:hypothetical protein AZE42_13911, partial [Rhizopogon vesiculosus]
MVVGFFYWETRVPVEQAAMYVIESSRTNQWLIFGTLLVEHDVHDFYYTVAKYIPLVGNINVLLTRLPISITAVVMSFTGSLSRILSPKWIILTGLFLCMVSTILLALGGGKPEDYWTYVFPALVMGGSGAMLTYTHT